MNAHRLGELRSIAYHRCVAERLSPELIARARERLTSWIRERVRNDHAAHRWLELLDGDREHLVTTMCADDDESRELRQSTPFAGVLSPPERWALWKTVREQNT